MEARLRVEATEADLAEPLEELQRLRDDQEPQRAAAEAARVRIQQSVMAVKAGIDALKDEYERKLQLRGRLTAEADAHQRAVGERDRVVREAAATLNLPRLPQQGALSPDQLSRFEAGFAEGLRAAEEGLREMRARNQAQDDELGRTVDAAALAVAAAKEAGLTKRLELQRLEQRLSQLQTGLGVCAVNPDMLEDAAAHAAASQAEAAAKQEQFDGQRFTEKIEGLSAQLETVNRRGTNLRQERDRITSAAESRTRIRLKQQELRGKDTQIASLINTRRAKLEAILATTGGGVPQPAQLKAAVQGAVQQRQEALTLKTGELRDGRQRSSELEGQLQAARAHRQSLLAQAQSLRDEIDRGMVEALGQAHPADHLVPCLNEKEREKEETQQTVMRLASLATCYEIYCQTARTSHKCMTCDRRFQNAQEQDAFLAKQERDRHAIPAQQSALQTTIESLAAKIGKLKTLQPKQLRLDGVEGAETRAVSERVRGMERQAAAQDEVLQRLQTEVAAAEHDLQDAQRLAQEVAWEVDHLVGEAAALRAELDALGLDSQTLGVDGGRDLAAIDADLEALDLERGSLEREREGLRRRQDRLKEELHAAKAMQQHAREGLIKAQAQADKAQALSQQVEGVQRDMTQLQQEMRSATEGIPGLEVKRDRLLRQRESRREAARGDEHEAEIAVGRWRDYKKDLDRRAGELREYTASGKATHLVKASRELDSLQQQRAALEEQRQREEQQLVERDREIKEHAESRLMMETLIDFKKRTADQAAKLARVEQIKREMAQIGNQGQFMTELTRLEDATAKLQSAQDMIRGSLKTIREQVQRAKHELQSVNYRDIDERFRKQLICLKTTEMANSDIDKYHKALEKALLAFHTTKMSDINKIIKELWQKTYRNQDIDYIQIKADADGARSYNYRVVMNAGGAELDMRGRCSAGQKVLACLIIRLALAETFCLNCGILALDEPTTNLDQANSASLADALRQIMEQRRGQENFQLVVITHDEQFANLIGTREHAAYLWRVTKDANQHSLVVQEDIAG